MHYQEVWQNQLSSFEPFCSDGNLVYKNIRNIEFSEIIIVMLGFIIQQ